MEAMENGEEGGKNAKKKLTIEKYLDFMDDHTLPLTVGELRQIIGMHGFKKIEARKEILTEMVASMELMDLQRSTLLELDGGVSGDACLTLEEVNNDLKFLKWQECHVTSLLAYGAATTSSTAGKSTVSLKRKRRKKSAKKAVDDNSAISTTGTTTT